MDSDDELTLSSQALAALQQFREEEKQQIKKFELLYDNSQKEYDIRKEVSIDAFQEDWQLSQFWYDDSTALTLAKALLEGADEDTIIVIASAPSVYAAISQIPDEEIPTKHIYLLEYDKRFELLAGKEHFRFYDYNFPENIPEELREKCHRLLIDPPFLEEECQKKSAETCKNLLITDKSQKTKAGDDLFKLITSTGERMKSTIHASYPDTFVTNFHPEHKNGLSNEFRCYATFECQYWRFEKNIQ